MKKLACLLFACALSCAIPLTACSNNADSGNAASSSASNATKSTGSDARATIDYSESIIGTWEGKDRTYDDQLCRIEYKADGTWVYYVPDGDGWKVSIETNCKYSIEDDIETSHWTENGKEHNETIKISIEDDKLTMTTIATDDEDATINETSVFDRVQ